MIEKTVMISNKTGLHARPASSFVNRAKTFSSAITISMNGETANGKSMISVLGLGVDCGMKISLNASGSDEQEAVTQLVALLENLALEEK